MAATAIEQGYADHTHDCPGYIQVEDVIFHCHNLAGHGLLNMTQALEKSCNPYFVSLIQLTGGESVAAKAARYRVRVAAGAGRRHHSVCRTASHL